jgi:hypothetical protein
VRFDGLFIAHLLTKNYLHYLPNFASRGKHGKVIKKRVGPHDRKPKKVPHDQTKVIRKKVGPLDQANVTKKKVDSHDQAKVMTGHHDQAKAIQRRL